MKIIRIISLAAAAVGFMTIGACKSNDPPYTPPSEPAGGSYVEDGK